jgi:amidase
VEPDDRTLARVDAVTDDALGADDATGLLARLAAGEVSRSELLEAALARAERVNPALNAVAAWTPSYRSADGDAPLAGIPTVVKDNEDLAGYPSGQGSDAVPHLPASMSSPVVDQLLRLGLVPVAKTTLPEFGLTATTESVRYGATRNPWDLARSSGGSSGGSAALVAAGVVPVAHANDGGGSIRIPAACCGLVGLKPSRGRVVDRPELERLPVQIAVQGVLTRTVRDTALYLAAAERLYANPSLPRIGHVAAPSPRRFRIGVVTSGILGLPLSAATTQAVLDAARLCERLGHDVEETAAPADDQFGVDFLRYWAFVAFSLRYAGAAVFGRGFDGRRTEPFTKGLSHLFVRSPERLPPAVRRLRRLAREGERGFDRYDLLLTPVVGHETPAIGHLGPDVPFRTHLLRLLRYTSFTPLQNVTGSPAVSLPLGRTEDGLPIGVQVVAPYGRDNRLLSLAYELEEAAPWPT